MRDLGALLALPSLWIDHEPSEIASGLLGVLVGMLGLHDAYARFQGDDGDAVEAWRPPGPAPAAIVRSTMDEVDAAPGLIARDAATPAGALRVARLSLALPWERGSVVVTSADADFPSPTEAHLLRVAVGQAAIAIHTARRLARERERAVVAEAELQRRERQLAELVAGLGPALEAIGGSAQQAVRLIGGLGLGDSDRHDASAPDIGGQRGTDPASDLRGTAHRSAGASDRSVEAPDLSVEAPDLSRREFEVLGLLAQGLSNREIAGLMWLSDRTVERHITSLYRKIGVARRSEATAFALRHGLR
ncbi:helix-turn-helix transcriptional regulator [Agromyces sp. LHK192]|uniref:helix-turn-helix transcriptional regulator n=1 Tax=Agromyces sp. LHK192 TaxID=2498704 RepID=UPI000FDA1ED6|nr:helix-turn-helix transcriptional regulator [Agromyces sp. LHK192]